MTHSTLPLYKNQLTQFLILFFFLLMNFSVFSYAANNELKKPKLILQITVDQLRGDLPTRYFDRLGKGGFRYLWQEGLVYSNAHHAHANTETIVGHATLATGAHPSIHGMIGNNWLDRDADQMIYNIEDPNYHLLTKGAGVDSKTEIDPTQRAARSDGRSPAAIMVSTFSDELKSYNNGQAKSFAVSIKDRGAVSMAGHAGKAFWFSKASGEFVTSNYYYEDYPQWVLDWNNKKLPQQYANQSWELMHDQQTYLFGNSDDREWETDVAGFGRVFPHPYGEGDNKYFTTLLTLSPAGDEITLDFAKNLLINEQLGQDDTTDYLAVSFSSTDYVGHVFGPSSLEAEDNLLRLDHHLAELFQFIEKNIGLKNTLIVLSSDHGAPDTPGYVNSLNIPGGYVEPSKWDKDAAISRVKKQFNIKTKLIESYQHPYLYLSKEVLENKNIDQPILEEALVKELSLFPGVYKAISSTSIQRGQLPETALNRKVINNFYAQRSGEIYLVFKPNWFVNDFDGLTVASGHGSPWQYDTYVPIVFAGAGIKAKTVSHKVHTTDIAPSLSAFICIKPPSGSVGEVLSELFD